MVKKILGIVAGCTMILLALFFFLTVLIRYQDFFGQAITLLLCGCIVILMLFVIYIMTSWILDAVRHGKHDEDKLSEKSLEKLLSGKSAGAAPVAPPLEEQAAEGVSLPGVAATGLTREQKRAAIEEKAARKKAEYEAQKAQEEARRQAEEARQAAASQRLPQEAAFVAPQAPAPESAPSYRQPPPAAPEKPAAAPQPVAEEPEDARKAQAVASARKQAEATATARRIAAQTAARTQAFAALDPDHLPEGGAPPPVPDGYAPANSAAVAQSESIWDKMQIRQSAAPQLSQREHIATAEYSIGPGGTLAPLPPVAATGTIRHTGVVPTGRMPVAAGATAPLPPQQGRPPLHQTMQGLPTGVRAPGQPMQGRPLQAQPMAPRPVQPVQGRPTQGQPMQGRPLQGQPAQGQAVQGRPQQGLNQTQPLPQGPPPAAHTGQIFATAQMPVAGKISASPPMPHTGQIFATGQMPVQRTGSGGVSVQGDGHTPTQAGASPSFTGQLSPQSPAEAEEAAKRPRGRPPKPKDPEEESQPKRPRGRPPKPKDPEEESQPKRPRGRPPKPKDPEEENKPKRPRGRPRKNPLEAEEQGENNE